MRVRELYDLLLPAQEVTVNMPQLYQKAFHCTFQSLLPDDKWAMFPVSLSDHGIRASSFTPLEGTRPGAIE
jgi:hypothetical protein